ncbi:hypothetical protein ACMDCR_13125 [Labrys okinawensis]|uniref:hypothetical protein n=1 Tax=Labrys okinawensis TaxID=346911 RepID=UPI0039BD6E9D
MDFSDQVLPGAMQIPEKMSPDFPKKSSAKQRIKRAKREPANESLLRRFLAGAVAWDTPVQPNHIVSKKKKIGESFYNR